jgi:hypothetical protein
VGIFHLYKHWHKKAVQYATRNLDLDYNISSFFRDLSLIRENTFKPTTIIHAFKNAGMWPPSCTIAIEKIKVYSRPEQALTPQLPPLTFSESERDLQRWKNKIPDLLSSPSRPQFQNWIKGTEEVLIQGQLKDLEHSILEQRVQEQRQSRSSSRRTLKTGGPLTANEARYLQAQKVEKEIAKEAKKAIRALKSQAIQARKVLHQAGIQARKEERARKKAVATLMKGKQPVPDHLLQPIIDPEAEAQAQAQAQEDEEARGDQESSEELGESGDESDESVQFFL